MKHRKLISVSALLCTAALLAGTLAAGAYAARPEKIHGLANATFVWENGAAPAETPAEDVNIGLPMLDSAVRQYLGLDEGEALTAEQLAEITVIRFETSVYNGNLTGDLEGKTAVKCVINGGVLPGAPSAGAIDAYGYELVPTVVRAKYFAASAINDEWNRVKFSSFFTRKDPADPVLTERAAAEMNALFPNTVADALVICDPEIKARELRELGELAVRFGIANTDTLLDGTEIPLTDADTALFPNLEVVEFTDGLMPANPLETLCMIEDCGLIAEVVFDSPLLNRAVREYFGLADGDVLTEDMAAQVETVTFCMSVWQEGLANLDGYEDKIAVKCIINGGAVTDEDGKKYPSVNPDLDLYENVFNGIRSVSGYEALPVTVRSEYFGADRIPDEWNRMKMKAFYTVKDIADPSLDAEAAEELLLRHPALAVDSFTFLDPMAKARELAELLKMGFTFGLVNEETILDSAVITLPQSDMVQLPGLILVECLDDFTVEITDGR